MSPARALVIANAMALATIRFHLTVAANPAVARKHLIDDGARVFSTRIVRGEDDDLAPLRRGAAHERTLGAVTIPAAAEDGDHAAISLSRFCETRSRASASILRNASSVCA